MSQENKKQEDCLLCESSKEAMDKLDLNRQGQADNVSSSRGMGMIVLVLIIIVGGFGGYRALSYFSSKSTSASNLDNAQSSDIITQVEAPSAGGPQIGSLAPNFSTSDIFGNRVALSDFRGKSPVLLVFWATWCGYCAKELPDLKIFNENYGDKIQVLAVASGETPDTIKEYIQEKNVNFLILLDETRKIWNQYLVRGTPAHFLIGKDGKIVTVRPGLALINDLEVMATMVEE